MSFLTIAVIGLLTFGLRALFLLGPRIPGEEKLLPILRGLPAAVMPALAVSSLLAHAASPDALAKLVAAIVVAILAWRTRSIAGSMMVGLLVFWALTFLGL